MNSEPTLRSAIDHVVEQLSNVVKQLEALNETQKKIARSHKKAYIPATKDAMVAIPALNQSLGMLAEHDLHLDQHNYELSEFKKSDLYKSALKSLAEHESLQKRFEAAFAKYDSKPGNYEQQRTERLAEILQLAGEIVAHFAEPPAAQVPPARASKS